MTYSSRRTAAQWESVIDQWQRSNQSAAQFCKEQNIGYASFCSWRKRLSVSEPPLALPTPAHFIDLESLSAPAGGGWEIVLSLGNGVELRLSQS